MQAIAAEHSPRELIAWSARIQATLTNSSTSAEISECAKQLVPYLESLSRCSKEQWLDEQPLVKGWISRQKNVHNSFSVVIDELNNRGNKVAKVLRALLVQEQWDPTPLLMSLDVVHEQKEGTEHYWENWYSRDKNTVRSVLFQTLLVGIDHGWRPPDLPIYGDMWRTSYARVFDARLERVNALREALPSGTQNCLTALLLSTNIDPEVIAPMFPLSLSSCDSALLAELLVSLITEGGQDDLTYKAIAVRQLLKEHHPEAFGLLSMHLDMMPNVSERNTYAELLVEGFNALLGRPTKSVETLPLCLGDDAGMGF